MLFTYFAANTLMPFFTDQTGRKISLEKPPASIVSLVPSQTELLHYLGLEDEVKGITKFCVHPTEWFRNKTRIGGTKNVHIDAVRNLHPDLILANKEENVKEQVDALAQDFPVWVSDVNTLDDAYSMINAIGEMTGKMQIANELVDGIQQEFQKLSQTIDKNIPALRSTYLIWREPYMTIGHDTFIHNMLTLAGFKNIFAGQQRYPATSIEQLQELNCQLLLLSSEPFPFKQKHVLELQPLLPNTKIVLVDGEMFSWYGSRLLLAPGYFAEVREMVYSL